MTGYLRRLAELAVGEARRVEPRLPSRFEPLVELAPESEPWWDEVASEHLAGPALRGVPGRLPEGEITPEVGPIPLAARPPALTPPRPERAPAAPPDPALPPSAPEQHEPPGPAQPAPARAATPGEQHLPLVRVSLRGPGVPAQQPEPVPAERRPVVERPTTAAPPPVPPVRGKPAAPAPAPYRPMAEAARRTWPERPPAVHVHIDRVEVRAVQPPVPPVVVAAPTLRATTGPDLEAYLAGGGGGP